jgi:hypothetical protein
MPVNEIVIHDDGHDDMRLRLAARDLLDALIDLVERDRAEAASSGFTDDEMSWLEDARRAQGEGRRSRLVRSTAYLAGPHAAEAFYEAAAHSSSGSRHCFSL